MELSYSEKLNAIGLFSGMCEAGAVSQADINFWCSELTDGEATTGRWIDNHDFSQLTHMKWAKRAQRIEAEGSGVAAFLADLRRARGMAR